jgi:lysophospholipase L1-like esterase
MANHCDASCGRCSNGGADGETPSACPGTLPPGPQTTYTPYPRAADFSWMSVAEWCSRHDAIINDPARSEAQLVFVGDSITQGWTDRARDVWDEKFGKYKPLRVGIGGDQTQNVLWRIQHGELDGLANAKAVVLLIGVNNLGLGSWSPSDTARGVSAVIAAIQTKVPKATILNMAVFPAMQRADDPFRAKIAETNTQLAALADGQRVIHVNIGERFLSADGSISSSVLYDYLHPDRAGYAIWADGISSQLQGVFGY